MYSDLNLTDEQPVVLPLSEYERLVHMEMFGLMLLAVIAAYAAYRIYKASR